MIVRLMGEGQYRIDDSLREQLNALDDEAMQALDAEDEKRLDAKLQDMWDLVQSRGRPAAVRRPDPVGHPHPAVGPDPRGDARALPGRRAHPRPAGVIKGRQVVAAAALVAGATAAVAVTAFAVGMGDDAGAEVLPDLDVVAPGQLTGRNAGTPAEPRFFLGFASAAANVGDGPLTLVGQRMNLGEQTMSIVQRVRREDDSHRSRPVRGALRFVRSPDHAHWHYLGFMRYQLRRPDGRVVLRDRKTGFCLGDRYRVRRPVPGAGANPSFPDECGRRQPELLRIVEGIAVGWGDDYDPHLEGQELDVTDLPAGRYVLVHRVNADRRLLESNYANNDSALVLDLTWPRGRKQSPRVAVVTRCADKAQCP